ncbi:hypothetical protein [Cupriavidus sp.]|uniref:hypothetical protein n=1 Tax=Cupriavidus sp. TaxID=1873897 RepID=UPI0031D7163D
MAIKVKNATLQLRLSGDLLSRFQEVCQANETTVSEHVRRWIVAEVQAHEGARERAGFGRGPHAPQDAPNATPAPPPAPRASKPPEDFYGDEPVTISGREVGGLKRKERRELEKQARKK